MDREQRRSLSRAAIASTAVMFCLFLPLLGPVAGDGGIPQPLAPPGFIYVEGTNLMLNGGPIPLFGVNEATAYTYALYAYGRGDTGDRGKNQNFPSGPLTQLPNPSGLTTADDMWREYFRYYLHYKQTGDPGNPPANLIRINIADLNFAPIAYEVFEADPAKFFEIFDRMLYWANRSGVYVVPILSGNKQGLNAAITAYYDTTSPEYARHLAYARAIMQRYDSNPTIAFWDLWNEADVGAENYWASVGGGQSAAASACAAWEAVLIADLEAYSTNHPITVGHGTLGYVGMWAPWFTQEWFDTFNAIPGLDISNTHNYGWGPGDDSEITRIQGWADALGKPYFVGEFGERGPNQYSRWFTEQSFAAGAAALASMVWYGSSPYADYPYLGALPDYPPEGSPGNQLPVASFTWSPTNPNANQVTTFDASASADPDGSIVSYAWTFGDGTTGSGQVAQKSYAQNGTYAVRLTVTDNGTATASTTRTITVGSPPPPNTPPTADFTFTPSSPRPGDTVTFDASPSSDPDGTVVRWQWWFEDNGGTATGEMVTHPFPNQGSWDVWLTVTDDDNAAHSVMRTVTVAPGGPAPNQPPVASFTSNPANPTTNDVITFDGSASSDPDGSIVSYAWTFGDGTTGSGRISTKAYFQSGSYTVRLSVTDNGSATGSIARGITVGSPAPPNSPPTAAFTFTPQSPLEGQSVVFDGRSSGDDKGISQYRWDFGNGDTAQGANPTYAYAVPGSFNVTLTVTDTDGATDSHTQSITVRSAAVDTSGAPRVVSVSLAASGRELDIVFSEAMDGPSVVQAVSVAPSVPYRTEWAESFHLRLVFLASLTPSGTYSVTILTGAKDLGGSSLENDFLFSFIAPPSAPAGGLIAWVDPWSALLILLVGGLVAWCTLLAVTVRHRHRISALAGTVDELKRRMGGVEPVSAADAGLSRVPGSRARRRA